MQIRLGDLTNLDQVAFGKQILLKLTECCLLPLPRGLLVVSVAIPLQREGNGLLNGQMAIVV
jgi:hypothetical protein